MITTFLTPTVEKFLAAVAHGPIPASDASSQRAALDGAMAQLGWPADRPADEITDAAGVPVHIFWPDEIESAPLIAYVHGGSFVAGGVPAHTPVARALAQASGCHVALIDYRLAPEHRSPAAVDDCLTAIRMLRADSRFASRPFAVIGDSAGGAIAVACALRLTDHDRPTVLTLVNPMTSSTATGGSFADYAVGYFATAADFRLGWKAYEDPGSTFDLLSRGDLSGLPPLLVFTNEADPVRDQGEKLAELASRANVPAMIFRMRGVVHAAWLFPSALPEAALIMDAVAGATRARLLRS